MFALLDAAGSTDLPDWARDLFSLDGLAGTAKFSLAPERLDITEFLARGAGFTLEGELRKHGEHTRGVLFVIGKVFSFGIVSTNGDTHISPVPASGWYNAQTQQGKSMP